MNKSMWVAIALSIGLLLWVISGPERQTEQVAGNDETSSMMKVQVKQVQAESVDTIIKIQGELLPSRSVTLRAETHGRVSEIDIDKSDLAKVGQSILAIALDDRGARLEGAKAELLKAESDLEANRKLFKRGLLSSSQLKQDEADYAAAKAQLSQIKNEIDHTQVRAPFSGVIDDRFVEVGDYVQSGDELARLLDISTLKMTGWVPQQKASALENGQLVTTRLVNDDLLTGVISYVAPQANVETRAFKVEVTIVPKDQVKLLGSSVSAEIVTGQQVAHFLSPSVISLGADGSLSVKTVNEENKVTSYPVKVLQSESNGVWLTGLPDVSRVITMGHGFVLDGQEVEVMELNTEQTAVTSDQGNNNTDSESTGA